MASAGFRHTVLIRNDGRVAACGLNDDGQCTLPALEDGVTYVLVSAGGTHTVLLRSDGRAAACGLNLDGQCTLPALEDGVTYVQVSAGFRHTVLLRSDGRAAACGRNLDGQCALPSLRSWREFLMCAAPRARYVRDSEHGAHTSESLAVQLCFCKEGSEIRITAESISGHELGSLRVNDSDCAGYLQQALANLLGVSSLSLHAVAHLIRRCKSRPSALQTQTFLPSSKKKTSNMFIDICSLTLIRKWTFNRPRPHSNLC